MRWFLLLLIGLTLQASPFGSDIPKAFQRIKKDKKPLMIDFYGIWCPPCNELDETVFESSEFLQKSKSFELLKVDADAESSWKLKDKYKVGGYPTVVFTDPNGEELYRIVGYRNKTEFSRIMDLVLKAKGTPLAKACENDNVEDLWRCAVICSEREDKACLNKTLPKLEKKLTPGTARYELLRTLEVEHSSTEDLKRAGYEKLIQEMPSSPQALLWASGYWSACESQNIPPKKELVEKVLAHYSVMKADPKKDELGIPISDIVQLHAHLLDKLGRREDAKVVWKEAADLLAGLSQELPKGAAARGFTLERISALENAGDVGGALKLAEEYRGKFPKEFTYHYIAGNLLERQKKYPEAMKAGKSALEFSYGDNKIRVATLMVRLYSALGDKESGKKLVTQVKKEIQPSAKLDVRTHRYLKKLEATVNP
jgi:thiol-disulfide isomerase/thioredoxin/tetratricopeptide (TPR) repeat protein